MGTRTIITNFMVRAMMTLLFLCFTAQMTWAEYGEVVAQGPCGDNGNHATFTLKKNSDKVFHEEGTGLTLTISGFGSIKDYSSLDERPWNDYKTKITEVVVNQGVEIIGNAAFREFSSLYKCTISSSVTSIKGDAFRFCDQLMRVIVLSIDRKLPTLKSDVFSECPDNCTFYVPSNYESSDRYWKRYQDQMVTYDDSWISDGTTVLSFPDTSDYISLWVVNSGTSLAMADYSWPNDRGWDRVAGNVREVEIFPDVVSIGNNAFANFTSLLSITIPDRVNRIGHKAFSGCSELSIVDLPSNLSFIFDETFKNCSNLTSITLPDNVSIIDSEAFSDCTSLESVIFPSHLSTISERAFYRCSNLTTITLPDRLIQIGNKAFSDCTSLESVIFPSTSNLNTISNETFKNCSNLMTITLPQYVNNIGSEAFSYCTSLESVIIPSTSHLESISERAFYRCSNLTTITLPNSVRNIDSEAFKGCNRLKDLYFEGIQTQWNNVSKGEYWNDGVSSSFKEHWRCTVSFDANGHGTAPSAQTNLWSNEDKVTKPDDLVADSYDFYGWYTDANGTTAWDFSNDIVPGDMTLYALWNAFLQLSDNTENDLTAYNLQSYSVTLQDRTLWADGDWNTLCLPFSLDSFTGSPLEGFTVMELDTENENGGHKTGFDSGTLYLNFKDAMSIDAGKPYIVKKGVKADLVISSESDWNTFAQNVSNGMSYEGQVVRLGSDISVSTMTNGTFKGTFDGSGYTINLNLNGGGDALALFYAIDAATIQNVKVTGTITSNYHRPATFTSYVVGNCTIKNCWSSVDIVSTKTSGWIDGGAFVARVNAGATLNMTDCLFTGSVTYHGGTSGGGMVGFTQSNTTANLTNCLFCPSALTLEVTVDNPHVFVSGDVRGNLTNCYYNTVANASVLENEGIDGSSMSTAELASALGTNWEVSGNNILPKCPSDIHNPIFRRVPINAANPTAVTSEDETVSFVGCYSPFTLYANDRTNLYLGSDNTLYYPSTNVTINSCRAYFQLNGISAAGISSEVNAFVLNFGDDDKASGIVDIDHSPLTIHSADGWYTLDGRKLSGKPTQKGIYIKDGKKMVVK